MPSIEQTEQNQIDEEWEQIRKWFNVTRTEGYDETIFASADERLNILMEGMWKPEQLKKLEGYKELSVDNMRHRAAGEIDAWMTVRGWKSDADIGFQRLQEARADEQSEHDETEDVSPFTSEPWPDGR